MIETVRVHFACANCDQWISIDLERTDGRFYVSEIDQEGIDYHLSGECDEYN